MCLSAEGADHCASTIATEPAKSVGYSAAHATASWAGSSGIVTQFGTTLETTMRPVSLRSNEMQPGDIIGFSGANRVSDFINVVTYGIPRWSLSHIGIVGEYKDERVLFESTTLDPDPCLVRGERFNGAQAHSIDSRIAHYEGRIWHYPLYRSLYPAERQRLNEFLNRTIGTPYDKVGAFRAGGIGFSWLESKLHPVMSLNAMFCSEWCAAAHTDIGLFRTDDVGRWSPNLFVRAERRQRILLSPVRMK
jgi:hypothetical protein